MVAAAAGGQAVRTKVEGAEADEVSATGAGVSVVAVAEMKGSLTTYEAAAAAGSAGWRVLACGFELVDTGDYLIILEKKTA